MRNRTLLSAVSLLLSVGLTPALHAEDAPAPDNIVPDIYEVKASSSGSTITIGGTVVPKHEVNLAAQMPGRIDALAGKEGDAFKTGDILIALDTNELLAQKEAAKAAIAAAEAAANNARVQYNREYNSPQSDRPSQMSGMAVPGMMDQMFSRPMASVMGMENPALQRRADLHQSGTRITQAEAAIAQAKAKLRQVEAKLRDAQTVAPFDGIITSKQVQAGDTVQPGQRLLTFANLNQLQVKIDVPARLSRKLKAGDTISARFDSNSTSINGVIEQVFPVADPQRHTVIVKVDLPSGVDAAPGMYADVLIPDPDSHGPARASIPRSTLIWRGSLPGVMLIDGDGKPQLKLIRISDTGNANSVQVFAGLKVGDKILSNPN